MAQLNEAAVQRIARLKARYFLVRSDGTLYCRGSWAFNVEENIRKWVADLPGIRVYDRETDQFIAEGPAMQTAAIPEVVTVEPVITDPTPSGAALDASEQAAAPVDPPIMTGVPEVDAALASEQLEQGEPIGPAPDTAILDSVINLFSDNGKAKKRKGRPDGKPRAFSVKAEAQARAGIKAPKAKKAAKRRRDAA